MGRRRNLGQEIREYHKLQEALTKKLIAASESGDDALAAEVDKQMRALSRTYADEAGKHYGTEEKN